MCVRSTSTCALLHAGYGRVCMCALFLLVAFAHEARVSSLGPVLDVLIVECQNRCHCGHTVLRVESDAQRSRPWGVQTECAPNGRALGVGAHHVPLTNLVKSAAVMVAGFGGQLLFKSAGQTIDAGIWSVCVSNGRPTCRQPTCIVCR